MREEKRSTSVQMLDRLSADLLGKYLCTSIPTGRVALKSLSIRYESVGKYTQTGLTGCARVPFVQI